MRNCRAKRREIATTRAGTASSIVSRSSSTNRYRSKRRRNMNTEEVANKVVELVRKQAWYEALDALYDDDIVSVEATTPETRGKEGVRGKIDWWVTAMQVHSFNASQPSV